MNYVLRCIQTSLLPIIKWDSHLPLLSGKMLFVSIFEISVTVGIRETRCQSSKFLVTSGSSVKGFKLADLNIIICSVLYEK